MFINSKSNWTRLVVPLCKSGSKFMATVSDCGAWLDLLQWQMSWLSWQETQFLTSLPTHLHIICSLIGISSTMSMLLLILAFLYLGDRATVASPMEAALQMDSSLSSSSSSLTLCAEQFAHQDLVSNHYDSNEAIKCPRCGLLEPRHERWCVWTLDCNQSWFLPFLKQYKTRLISLIYYSIISSA